MHALKFMHFFCPVGTLNKAEKECIFPSQKCLIDVHLLFSRSHGCLFICSRGSGLPAGVHTLTFDNVLIRLSYLLFLLFSHSFRTDAA